METKKTALYQKHLNLNAKMSNFAGYSMPLQYQSSKDEVLAVRNHAGMFDVSHMGEFFVEGSEAVNFIDFMLTNDFKNAENLKAVYSPLCREDGTIIDDLIAYKLSSEKVLVCVNAANISKDWDWFSSHVDKFDCQLTNQSEDFSLIAVQGPDTEQALEELQLLDGSEFPYYSVRVKEYGDGRIILARTGYTGEDGFELFCSHNVAEQLWEKLSSKNIVPCGLIARDILRIEVCYPLYGKEINDDVTPLDSALKWAVKLDKENFIGKDALLNYQPRFRLVKLSIDKGIPREDYPVLDSDGRQIGRVTSGTMSITINKGAALALIEKDKFPENKKLFIKIRNNIVEAEINKRPFVSGGHK